MVATTKTTQTSNNEHGTSVATATSTPLDLRKTFRDKKMIVIGGTGFLGKVWVSLLLKAYPEVGHLYLLVRPKKGMTTVERFWSEIVPSETFTPLRQGRSADEFRDFINAKITPVAGDVGHPMVGIDAELLKELHGQIDVVVNVAGVVDFNPPINEAIRVNCFGVKHLIELCSSLGDVPVMHTSTCFVAGNRDGLILEEDPLSRPFPRCGDIDIKHWDPHREIEEGFKIAERANVEANEAFRESEFLEQAKENLQRKGESCRGKVLANELEKVRKKFVDDTLSEQGMDRAKYWGWTNTYTYSKSIGEQLLRRSGLRCTIVRPAIVESSVEYPVPGWNEGINTSAPLLYMIIEAGVLQMPGSWDCNLDLIPNDMVCCGMIAALGALLDNSHEPVYQLGGSDLNPVSSARCQELASLYKRRSARKHPKGNPFFNSLRKLYGSTAVTPETMRKYGEPFYADVADSVSKLTSKAAEIPGFGFLKKTSKSLAGTARTLRTTAKIYDTFMPFMYTRQYRFSAANMRALFQRLEEADHEHLFWSPETIDWRYWMMELHLPGLEKWVFPLIKDKLKKPKKQLRAYADLVSMLDEVVEDNEYGVCMQRLTDDRLERLTYGQFRNGVEGIAAQLQADGVQAGDRILLSGQNSPFWGMAYFGVLRAGATAVPIDPDFSAERLRNIYVSSKASYAIWDETFHEECGAAFLELLGDNAGHGHTNGTAHGHTNGTNGTNGKVNGHSHVAAEGVVSYEVNGTVNGSNGNNGSNGTTKVEGFGYRLLDDIAEQGMSYADKPAPIDVDPDDVASLIFTSGTTGDPKGVMLTHRNFTSILSSLVPLFPVNHEDCSLSLLPLHHTFEFTCGLLLPLSRGTRITYLEELNGDNVVKALQEAQVTVLVGVPALWQLLERRVRSEVKQRGETVKSFFELLLKANEAIGRNMGFDLGRLFFAPVHKQFGGNLKYLISGGASLPKKTQELFNGLGLYLAEGYGLTEAAPVLTVAVGSPKSKFGQVGKAIPGVEIKIHEPNDDGVGEVWARGGNVMLGYADNPEATSQVLSDGWLRTGDLGKLDHKGRLTLVGRAKEVILTSNGENVYPDDLEEMIGLPESVEELVIVGVPDGSGSEQVGLLAVPKKPEEDEDNDIVQRIQRARKDLQARIKTLPRHSRPTIIHFSDLELPRTATRKVKRREVQAMIQHLEHQSLQELPAARTPLSNQIVNAISKITGADIDTIYGAKRLASDLGIDSLMMNELHMELERVMKRTIPAEPLAACETIYEIQRLLEEVNQKKASKEQRRSRKHKEEPKKENDTPILPSAVQETAKDWMRGIQLSFYNRVMDLKVYGRANIPHNRNTIVVSNHTSHLDLGVIKTALGSYAKDIVTLGAKDYFFEGDKLRKFYFENFTNVLPVSRVSGELGLAEAHKAIRENKTLLIFPEGTRGKTGIIQTFKSGVGHLSLEHEIDILPVYVQGTFEAMPKGRPLPTKRKLRVKIGEPLRFSEMAAKFAEMPNKKLQARAIAALSQQAVEALREGKRFEMADASLDQIYEKPVDAKDMLNDLFEYISDRFDPERVENPVSFYFSLGQDSGTKWSLIVGKDECKAHRGKPENGNADCVLKTSPEIFRQIVKEAYVPSPEQFISGMIKSNNIPLLQDFVRIFDLQGEASDS